MLGALMQAIRGWAALLLWFIFCIHKCFAGITGDKPLNIAVLNACGLREEHIATLSAYGNVLIYDDTDNREKVIERLDGVHVAIANAGKVAFDRELLGQLPYLKLLAITSSGYNQVDVSAARDYGIAVANAAGYSSESVAEHTIALMLAVVRKIPLCDRLIREHPFEVIKNTPTDQQFLSYNLRGKTVGLVGFGHIAKAVAALAHGFGMNVIVYTRSPVQMEQVVMVDSLATLLRDSDIVSLHVPLTSETENLIADKELALMKPSAIIINTARGKIINTEALFHALSSKKIRGAGLDVLAEVDKNNPLLTLDNVVFTPHAAFYAEESRKTLAAILVQNIVSFMQGTPVNIVN